MTQFSKSETLNNTAPNNAVSNSARLKATDFNSGAS